MSAGMKEAHLAPDPDHGVTVCDSVLKEHAEHYIDFTKMGDIKVKGKAILVSVYVPVGVASRKQTREDAVLIGREALSTHVNSVVYRLVQGFDGGLLLLQGFPGTGKTVFLQMCTHQWKSEHILVLGADHDHDHHDTHGQQESHDIHDHRDSSGHPEHSHSKGTIPFRPWLGVLKRILLMYREEILSKGRVGEKRPVLSPKAQSLSGLEEESRNIEKASVVSVEDSEKLWPDNTSEEHSMKPIVAIDEGKVKGASLSQMEEVNRMAKRMSQNVRQ
ncbi:unnamed protein product [Chrysoparadoxa australica]